MAYPPSVAATPSGALNLGDTTPTHTDHHTDLKDAIDDIVTHLTTKGDKRTIQLRTMVAAGTVPLGGAKVFLVSPLAFTITGWRLVADVATNATLDIWKAAAAIPTNADTITASAKPSLVAATVASSTTLTGWTTAIAVGDILELEIEANSSATVLNLTLEVTLG